MSVPMRKDDFVEKDELIEEELTTADLAQGKRPAGSLLKEDRVKDDLENDLETDRANPDSVRPDLAQGGRRGPVLAERPASATLQNSVSDVEATGAANRSNVGNPSDSTPLFPNNELEELRSRWNDVQTAFVDEPRRAVEQADGLVASAMKRLAEVFAEERSKLEHQWDRGDNVSTEDLRVALQRYRSFFQRLMAI